MASLADPNTPWWAVAEVVEWRRGVLVKEELLDVRRRVYVRSKKEEHRG